jgi:polyisoprenoid-binding protein YceI
MAQAANHPATAGTTRYSLAPDGNEARYIVRERLAGLDFPNDAIGRTTVVTGGVALDDKGNPLPSQSHFTVDLTTLKSDKANRDRYLRTKALESDRFPKAELTVTALRNFPASPPASGAFTFQLVGTLTIHGVSRPTTWTVNATAENGGYRGTAATEFKFGDFGMDVPRAFVVLSVEDDIKLQYDFHLLRDTTTH